MSKTIFRKDGTAQGVAKQRLIESLAQPNKRVIYDPYAKRFVAGAGIIKLMGHKFSVWLTQKLAPGFHEHLISRTRFIDDLVKKCAADGIEQYVILGAGYDLRAHRLNLPSTLNIFEVDQLEVQNRKQAKLPKALTQIDNITYVNVDFNTQTITERLLKSGFDPSKTTLFTLEGVSQYITKEAVKATLTELSQISKSADAIFYMSYVDKLLKDDPKACFGEGYPDPKKIAERILNMSEKVGEPWISLYSEDEVNQILQENGFSMTENKTLVDLNKAYFTPVGREVPAHHVFNLEHSIVATSVKS